MTADTPSQLTLSQSTKPGIRIIETHPAKHLPNGRHPAKWVCQRCGATAEAGPGTQDELGDIPCDPDGDHSKHYTVKRQIEQEKVWNAAEHTPF